MGVRQYKPTSAGRRAGMVSDFSDCTYPGQNRPERSLLEPLPKTGGRNHHGIITSRFRGGGHKRMLRLIDFKRKKDGVEALVLQVEYDPCRSARIALVQYQDETKEIARVLKAIKVGKKVVKKGDEAVEKDVTLADGSVLIGTAGYDPNVYKSGRNIEGVKVLPAAEFNAYTVLRQKRLLLTKAALEVLRMKSADRRPEPAAE